MHCNLPAAWLPRRVCNHPKRAVEEPPALSRRAPLLDQLPGAYVRHDLPDARHGADQYLAPRAWRDPRAAHHPLHALLGDGWPGLWVFAVHDSADLCLAREAR